MTTDKTSRDEVSRDGVSRGGASRDNPIPDAPADDGGDMPEAAPRSESRTISRDLEMMTQTVLDIVSIYATHRDHDPDAVMGGLMDLVEQLETSYAQVSDEMHREKSPARLQKAIMAPMPLAVRYGATDLDTVTRRTIDRFTDIIAENGTLTPQATADTLIWMSACRETQVAARLLFQAARFYGRAPNGKRFTNGRD